MKTINKDDQFKGILEIQGVTERNKDEKGHNGKTETAFFLDALTPGMNSRKRYFTTKLCSKQPLPTRGTQNVWDMQKFQILLGVYIESFS